MSDPLDLPDLDAFFAQLEAQVGDTPTAPVPTVAAVPPVVATALEDRREAARVAVSELGRDVRLSIRGGADAKPINVSETGVLAETSSRLRPGGAVELLLQIDGTRQRIKATVVRSMVHSLGPTIFRTAFKFEERTKLPERK